MGSWPEGPRAPVLGVTLAVGTVSPALWGWMQSCPVRGSLSCSACTHVTRHRDRNAWARSEVARSWLEVLGAFPRGHDVWLEDESIPSAARHDSQHWEAQTGFSWCWGVSVGLQLPRNPWGITKTIIQGSACLTAG